MYFLHFWKLKGQDQDTGRFKVCESLSFPTPFPSPDLLPWFTDRQHLFSVPSHGWRGRGPFIRALLPFTRALLSWPSHFPKAPLPNSITLGVEIWTHKVWKHTDNQSTGSIHLLSDAAITCLAIYPQMSGQIIKIHITGLLMATLSIIAEDW